MKICTRLNSLRPSNNASKSSHKLCYGKISFIVLVPGLGLESCNRGRGIPLKNIVQEEKGQNYG